MYAGKIAEEAPTRRLFAQPLHPYTRGLLRERARATRADSVKARLTAIPGMVPDLRSCPRAAAFRIAAARVQADCRQQPPSCRYRSCARRVSARVGLRVPSDGEAAP